MGGIITRAWTTETLRQLQAQHGDLVEPHLVVDLADPRLRGSNLFPCDAGGLPALHPGSRGGCRISTTDGPDGLHFEMEDGHLEIHLDRVCARRAAADHLVDATEVKKGLLVGTGIGVLAAIATGKPIFLAAGAAGGAALGALTPRRETRYFLIQADGNVRPVAAGDRIAQARLQARFV